MAERTPASALAAVIPAGTDRAALPFLAIAGDPAATRERRIEALRAMVRDVPAEAPGGANVPEPTGEINNHVHTVYSFSPYTPAMAAWRARASALAVAGSVDHDSISAAREMLEACAVLGIGGTAGFELRASCLDSPFGTRKLNNPDSIGIAYMTVQGVPRQNIGKAADFLKPVGVARGKRNRKTTAAASVILERAGYGALDYDRDVVPLSRASEGGSVTERHILAAVAAALLERHGAGAELISGLAANLDIQAPAKVAALLSDPGNPHLGYDLLGFLKSGFLDRVFVQPGPDECLPVEAVTAFARSIGAIPAYAYLGDVADSPTGDKKAEKFEDEFLDDLLPWLSAAGFQAVTYMPPRNTPAQLSRVRGLCEKSGLMEISGVDINSSRQTFSCPEVLAPSMARLVDTTWALVAHERLSSMDLSLGLFSQESPLAGLPLAARIDRYAEVGRGLDPRNPDDPETLSRLVRNWRR